MAAGFRPAAIFAPKTMKKAKEKVVFYKKREMKACLLR
jgi:hypothetical protein